MLYDDAPIGLCVEGLGSWGVLLSGMRVEPIGGVADQNVIRDWGLQSRLYTPSLALSHLLPACGERFAPLQAPGLHLPFSRFARDPQLWVPRLVLG